jgi:acetyl esterase/lipase
MTSLSSLVGPYPTGIVRLVLDEMFAAVIRSIRVIAAVLACTLCCGCHVFQQMRAADVVEVIEALPYVENATHPRHHLDLYLPKNKTTFPVLHFVHGGYWMEGDRHLYAWLTGLYGSMGIALAKQGVGVVVQSYRLVPEVGFAEQFKDINDGIRWTQSHIASYGGNPKRVFLMGHSAGGHLLALHQAGLAKRLGLQHNAHRVRAYFLLSPVLDLVHMQKTATTTFNAEITDVVFGEDQSALELYSPAHQISAPTTRIWIALGENDYPYLREQVPRVAQMWKEHAPHKTSLRVIPDYSHRDMVLAFGDKGDPLITMVLSFIFKDQASFDAKEAQ